MSLRTPCGAALALCLAACEPAPAPEHPPGDVPPPATRAEVITDTLLLEGMPEPTTARLLQAPAESPIPFSTYVPDGIAASFEGGGDTLALRFAAAFTGAADPNAYMHFRFYSPAVGMQEARDMLSTFLAARIPEDAPVDGRAAGQAYRVVDPPAWGDEAFALQYRGEGNRLYVGRLVIGTRRDRIFHLLTHYPAEYGDGLAPRFDRILDLWRWDDTGEPLRGSAPPQP